MKTNTFKVVRVERPVPTAHVMYATGADRDGIECMFGAKTKRAVIRLAKTLGMKIEDESRIYKVIVAKHP